MCGSLTADQRELELLVQAGLTPEAAVRVATLNGAILLDESDHIGSIAAGRQADLVLVRGNPAQHIADVKNVEIGSLPPRREPWATTIS
jgi:imidazolonepropionase-like amidohydrolase